MRQLNRRRFLLVTAGSVVGLAGSGWEASRHRPRLASLSRGWHVVRRTTFALGTDVSITARHLSAETAERAIVAAFDELALVERLMSIYRPNSQISRLNREHVLLQPHPYVVAVLRYAQLTARRTGGAFDVSVQPLWEVFAEAVKEKRLPEESAVVAARAKVDWTQIDAADDCVRLKRPGMKLTLNGIAQGFAADRVLAVLRARGVEHALINTGELESLGCSERGDAWRAGIQHPRHKEAYIALAALDGRALATSGDYASMFSSEGRHNHIFDPRSGYSPTELASVSVLAPSGMAADALSTACFVLGAERSLEWIKSMAGVDAFFVLKDGETIATGGFPLCGKGSAA